MKLWKIEYIQGHSMHRFKSVEADVIRMSKITGDMWFCNNNDIDADGNYQPKMILSKGSYLTVERMKMPKVDNVHAERMEVNIVESYDVIKNEDEDGWI